MALALLVMGKQRLFLQCPVWLWFTKNHVHASLCICLTVYVPSCRLHLRKSFLYFSDSVTFLIGLPHSGYILFFTTGLPSSNLGRRSRFSEFSVSLYGTCGAGKYSEYPPNIFHFIENHTFLFSKIQHKILYDKGYYFVLCGFKGSVFRK